MHCYGSKMPSRGRKHKAKSQCFSQKSELFHVESSFIHAGREQQFELLKLISGGLNTAVSSVSPLLFLEDPCV